MRRFGEIASLWLAGIALAACSRALPAPRMGPHVGDEPITVPMSPPAGKVEIVPPKPETMKDPVWIDGQWDWNGRRWVWKDGGWEDQKEHPPGSYYAPPATVRLADGTLVYFRGAWKDGAPGATK
jgi:hypothetical protein